MCFWGESLALGANINVPMDPEASPPAWEALQKAVAAADAETDVEKALIGALKARYSIDPKSERAPFDAAYADAMKAVHERFPGQPATSPCSTPRRPWTPSPGTIGKRTG